MLIVPRGTRLVRTPDSVFPITPWPVIDAVAADAGREEPTRFIVIACVGGKSA